MMCKENRNDGMNNDNSPPKHKSMRTTRLGGPYMHMHRTMLLTAMPLVSKADPIAAEWSPLREGRRVGVDSPPLAPDPEPVQDRSADPRHDCEEGGPSLRPVLEGSSAACMDQPYISMAKSRN
eukprot:scaffold425918_cov35-Prasinocladus_malaysianus.AAC.2